MRVPGALLTSSLVLVVLGSPVAASAPLYLSLEGPATLAAGWDGIYEGASRWHALGIDGAAPLAAQTVHLYVDDDLAATTSTDLGGDYAARLAFPGRGVHLVVAVANAGAATEARSAPYHVDVVVPPGAPAALAASTPSDAWHDLLVSWSAPVDDGGQAPTSYRVERSVAGGPFEPRATVVGLAWRDTDVVLETDHAYRVSAVNLAGAGPGAEVAARSAAPGPVDGLTSVVVGVSACPACPVAPAGERFGGHAVAYDVATFAAFLHVRGTAMSQGVPVAGRVVDVSVAASLTDACTGGPGSWTCSGESGSASSSGTALTDAAGRFTLALPMGDLPTPALEEVRLLRASASAHHGAVSTASSGWVNVYADPEWEDPCGLGGCGGSY